ncbi:hypothetical protein SAMN05216316_2595 [Nitrosovibrio sp. Nv6]|nr:hypothetical protein SAMN05216316_2595 [Nitrosovibrio sp. Nv6]
MCLDLSYGKMAYHRRAKALTFVTITVFEYALPVSDSFRKSTEKNRTTVKAGLRINVTGFKASQGRHLCYFLPRLFIVTRACPRYKQVLAVPHTVADRAL